MFPVTADVINGDRVVVAAVGSILLRASRNDSVHFLSRAAPLFFHSSPETLLGILCFSQQQRTRDGSFLLSLF